MNLGLITRTVLQLPVMSAHWTTCLSSNNSWRGTCGSDSKEYQWWTRIRKCR